MIEDDGPEELDEGPDERDADLGWGGLELPPQPALWQRARRGLFMAVLVLLLLVIILPLVFTALR